VARRRFDDLSPERQTEILQLAAEEFARSGFQGTSYNQLLERLQLGKSSAYYYFEDKRDLFLTVIERCYTDYFAELAQLPQPQSVAEYWDFVERSSCSGFESMLADPTLAGLLQCLEREQALLGELAAERVLQKMSGFYRGMLEVGQRLGAVRSDVPPALLAEVVRGIAVSFDRWFVLECRKPSFMGCAAAGRLFTSMVQAVLAP
jgi:AcrR family transcriptional regulator